MNKFRVQQLIHYWIGCENKEGVYFERCLWFEWSNNLKTHAFMRCELKVGATTKIATWLILPVVIRSSQRLSHACLSINLLLWNCEWLIISVIVYLIVPYYLDNRSNSRANTCANSRLPQGGKDVFIRSNQPGSPESLVSHNNWANRMALRRRWFIQVSALSAFDGRVLAYHGVNG